MILKWVERWHIFQEIFKIKLNYTKEIFHIWFCLRIKWNSLWQTGCFHVSENHKCRRWFCSKPARREWDSKFETSLLQIFSTLKEGQSGKIKTIEIIQRKNVDIFCLYTICKYWQGRIFNVLFLSKLEYCVFGPPVAWPVSVGEERLPI